ncbi:unnamed protein product [Lupinus luteus]|uniref:Exocyst subunit Exo70 family protein n=1 Tax=Lupinus luteus TaxID=3873 RepID=A0AAV1WLA9_LUPLU
MRGICFNPKKPSFSIAHNSNSSSSSTPHRLSFSDSIKKNVNNINNDENSFSIEAAEALIQKWNPDTSAYAKVTSLFYEDKTEAMQYINCVKKLHKLMHSLLIQNPSSEKLILSQNLMQIAMKRLKKEFYQILSMNRAHLDPESISVKSSRTSVCSSISDFDDDCTTAGDEIRAAGDAISEVERLSSIAMADLKVIADCMVSCGYKKECVSVYNVIRKSIIDEGVFKLGVEKVSSTRVNKMDWEVIELKIQSWLEAVMIAVRTLFNGERILCDHVFGAFESIKESCFAEISRDGAVLLFRFPELVAKAKKSAPEKIFRVLDMYSVIYKLLPEIETIFSSDSSSVVRSQVNTSLQRIIECVKSMLSEFESTIQKDSSKSPVNSGGMHSLTIQAMNYLSILADYNNVLSDMFSREEFLQKKRSPLPDSYLYSPESVDTSASPALAEHFAWLILVLLCKLDVKAKHCKDVSLSYLFFANNLRYIVTKIRRSNLQFILGEDWLVKHEEKVKRFVTNYERFAWGEVISSLPENPLPEISPAEVRMVFEDFNFKFEKAYRKQNAFVVADREMRDEIKGSIAKNVVSRYRELYNMQLVTVESVKEMTEYVAFTPEDVENYLSNLFFIGRSSSDVSTSSSSSVTSSPHQRRN